MCSVPRPFLTKSDNFGLSRYLEDLGASKLLMGASLAVGTAAGVPVTLFSRWEIRPEVAGIR